MRKRICMSIMLGIMVVVLTCCLYYKDKNNILLSVENGHLCVSICTEQSVNRVFLWQEEGEEGEGEGYFFLPSCVSHHKIRLGDIGEGGVRIDGKPYQKGDTFTWEEGHKLTFQVTDGSYNTHTYKVNFLTSANIPAMFIDLDGWLEYLYEDKENEESGKICVVQEDGVSEYQGELLRISGRGNSTWEYDKKPYAIKLKEAKALCGLDKSDRWQLLALWREGSKLDNKIAMDLSEALGITYNTQGTWVDLYIDGEYLGIYLLAESVTVGKGRVDIYDLEKENKLRNPSITLGGGITYCEETSKGYFLENGENISGGYLIEKDYPSHYEAESSGFETSRGDQFSIKSPQHASREQARYIQSIVENIDQMVTDGNPEVWDYLDINSFAKSFLMDELACDTDAGLTSMFFYKDRNDEKLYAGPTWDYDNAFGERNSDVEPGYDYQLSVVNTTADSLFTLDWYARLYENPQLQKQIIEEYKVLLPYLEEILDTKIDQYMEEIRASVAMDKIRWNSKNIWGDFSGKYPEYELNVRYMKYFLAKRLNFLCNRWGVEHAPFEVPSNGQKHLVTYCYADGETGTMEVIDGEEISMLPMYDVNIYEGWRDQYTGERFRSQIPVYCDVTFYNAKLTTKN